MKKRKITPLESHHIYNCLNEHVNAKTNIFEGITSYVDLQKLVMKETGIDVGHGTINKYSKQLGFFLDKPDMPIPPGSLFHVEELEKRVEFLENQMSEVRGFLNL